MSQFYENENTTPSVSGDLPAPPHSTEQDRYNSLLNTLRDYEEFTLNTAGTIMSSNLEAVSITGYEEWEVIGKHFSLFYTQEDLSNNKPDLDLKRAAENGRVHIAGWRVKKKNKNFWAKTKIQVMLDEQGQPSGFKMTLRDATHNVMYNYRVKNIRNEYLNLFNNSFIGIFKFRFEDSRCLILNEKATEIFDCSSPESVYFFQLFAQPTEFERLMGLLKQKRKIQGFEFQVNRDTQEEMWVSISCRHFYEGNFVEGIVIDITENKKHIMELERLNHELDEFIYHASHDLRSPLTSILGLVNLIQLDEPTQMIRRYSSMIEERIHHLDDLLKDLVAITYNSKSQIQAEHIQFDQEVKAVLGDFQNQYNHVQVFLEEKSACRFFTDVVRFRTILRNLISNGLKYHNPHAAKPYLRISVETNQEQFTLQLEDNGIGIQPEYQSRVFEMFFRATAEAKGPGLGLFIVKSMVEKLGGIIELQSERGKGSIFKVVLPNQINTKTSIL